MKSLAEIVCCLVKSYRSTGRVTSYVVWSSRSGRLDKGYVVLFGQVVAEDCTRRSISPKMTAYMLFRVVLSSDIGQGLFYMVECLVNRRQMGSLSSCRRWRQRVCCICEVNCAHVNMLANAVSHAFVLNLRRCFGLVFGCI